MSIDLNNFQKLKCLAFLDILAKPEYALQIYKELHPEDETVTVDDIEIIYSMPGFTVRDNVLVMFKNLIEWYPNEPFDLFVHFMDCIYSYFGETNQSVYSKEKVHLPCPENYVVYSGEKKIPEILSFADFFGEDNMCVNMKMKVFQDANTDTVIDQFLGFCDLINDAEKAFPDSLENVEELIDTSIAYGFLADFFKDDRQSLVDNLKRK